MANPIGSENLIVKEDAPDLRDRFYAPTLAPLQTTLHPPGNLYIQNQGDEGACTGFGLAATINLLYRQRDTEDRVSPRMLYAMAKRYDSWVGADYEGSTCRGALKGWRNSGVCSEELAPYKEHDNSFEISREISQDARQRTLGAYFRLRPVVSDFHAALNEAGVVFASAKVHKGWYKPVNDKEGEAVIQPDDKFEGGHAFAIVGYSDKGFWVQNSWGEKWGDRGLAVWTYADWIENVMDAWVVQLALPTPSIFDYRATTRIPAQGHNASLGTPPRISIENHFIHLDDGEYRDKGRYWTNKAHIKVVQDSIEASNSKHLVLYAHGGLNSTKDSAARISALKPVFLANDIYPVHFMYDTGLMEELKDVILRKNEIASQVSGGFRDWFDRRIENLISKPGRALWREMKFGAEAPFRTKSSDGTHALVRLLEASKNQNMSIHLVGHSTGAILLAYLIRRIFDIDNTAKIRSCSLLAPAAKNSLFDSEYVPKIKSGGINDIAIYNLTDHLEKKDTVAKVYGKSLLYLVSRAFEEESNEEILGMQKYNSAIADQVGKGAFVYSKGTQPSRSASVSHGGFDNDVHTMNDILSRILGVKPGRKFTEADLDY